jgi:hypothetical protein
MDVVAGPRSAPGPLPPSHCDPYRPAHPHWPLPARWLEGLGARAEAVLRANWRGRHTVPSASLYPHQWSWDSAFTAIGLAPRSQHRAQLELATLFGAQWADGRLPHIVFDPDTPADAYFPGPRFWAVDGPATPLRRTSGIVQPPVHARAAWLVYRSAPDREAATGFLRRAYEPLCAWHDYLLSHRDLGGSGLAAIVHPWESGMDNSPVWDAPLARLAVDVSANPARRDLHHVPPTQRPGDADYAAYVALAGAYRDRVYADDDVAGAAFAVEDPLFNGLLAWSEEALARIAAVVGADHHAHTARAHRLGAALTARLYDPAEGMFFARDLHAGALVPGWSAAGLGALVSPGLPEAVVSRVSGQATSARFGPRPNRGWLLPSADRTAATFDPQRYWRGPAWANLTWVVRQGLIRSGRRAAAGALSTGLLQAVSRGGFREYFDADTGEGAGARDFSWTAAITLDLLRERGLPGGR